MPISTVPTSPRLLHKLGHLSALALGVGSLVGGFTVLAGVGPAGAVPTNLYVAPSGSDTANSCTSQATPCQTLKHAYAVSSSGQTINLAAGTYVGGIDITHTLDIVGVQSGGSLNAVTSTINGGGAFPVDIGPGVTVSISNVVVSGGTESGVDNHGVLTLTNVIIQDNVGVDDGSGMFSNDKVVMNGGSFLENTQSSSGVGAGYDQGSGTSTFNNVQFNHNVTSGSGGEGGAIFNFGGTVHLTGNTSIHNNSASVQGGGVFTCPGQTTTTTAGVSITSNTPNDVSHTDTTSSC
jgi:hypothetical protein